MIKKISVHEIENQFQPESVQEHSLHYLPASSPLSWKERLSRNLALSGMLLLTILAVRNAELPGGETILTAVQQIVDQNWDDSLGKISFVSNLFPESVAVFFETSLESKLITPCFGTLSHAWSEKEPYLGYDAGDEEKVYAISSGQIMSISHGINEEKIIRIAQDDGVETIYYLTDDAQVKEGDFVTANTCLGVVSAHSQILIEVRQNGLPINPTGLMIQRSEDIP